MNRKRRKTGETDLRARKSKPMNTTIIPAPVVSRMARPRASILHLPGTYSGGIFIDFLKRVTSFICGPRHLDKYRWRALPRSHRKRITSLTQRGPRRPPILSEDRSEERRVGKECR